MATYDWAAIAGSTKNDHLGGYFNAAESSDNLLDMKVSVSSGNNTTDYYIGIYNSGGTLIGYYYLYKDGGGNTSNITASFNITSLGLAEGSSYTVKVFEGSSTTTTSGITYSSTTPSGTWTEIDSLATTFTYDKTGPGAPTVSLTTDSGVGGDLITNTAGLTVTGESGATFQYATSNPGNANSWSSTVPTPTQGSNTVYVRQVDAAGNTGTAYATFTYTYDTQVAPLVLDLTNDSGTPTDDRSNDGTVGVKSGQEAGATVYYSTDETGTYDTTAPTFTGDGDKTVWAYQVDKAGNQSAKNSYTFTLDTTVEDQLAITTPSVVENTQTVYQLAYNTSLNLLGTLNGLDIQKFEVFVGTSTTAAATLNRQVGTLGQGEFANNSSTAGWSLDATSWGLAEDERNTLKLKFTDIAGNTGTKDVYVYYNALPPPPDSPVVETFTYSTNKWKQDPSAGGTVGILEGTVPIFADLLQGQQLYLEMYGPDGALIFDQPNTGTFSDVDFGILRMLTKKSPTSTEVQWIWDTSDYYSFEAIPAATTTYTSALTTGGTAIVDGQNQPTYLVPTTDPLYSYFKQAKDINGAPLFDATGQPVFSEQPVVTQADLTVGDDYIAATSDGTTALLDGNGQETYLVPSTDPLLSFFVQATDGPNGTGSPLFAADGTTPVYASKPVVALNNGVDLSLTPRTYTLLTNITNKGQTPDQQSPGITAIYVGGNDATATDIFDGSAAAVSPKDGTATFYTNVVAVGYAGIDILTGADQAAYGDILYGGNNDDILDGKAGKDLLAGGLGLDRMTGGSEADTFIFYKTNESGFSNGDVITDFTLAFTSSTQTVAGTPTTTYTYSGDKIDVAAIYAGMKSTDANLAPFRLVNTDYGTSGTLTTTTTNKGKKATITQSSAIGDFWLYNNQATNELWLLGNLNGGSAPDFKVVMSGLGGTATTSIPPSTTLVSFESAMESTSSTWLQLQ